MMPYLAATQKRISGYYGVAFKGKTNAFNQIRVCRCRKGTELTGLWITGSSVLLLWDRLSIHLFSSELCQEEHWDVDTPLHQVWEEEAKGANPRGFSSSRLNLDWPEPVSGAGSDLYSTLQSFWWLKICTGFIRQLMSPYPVQHNVNTPKYANTKS